MCNKKKKKYTKVSPDDILKSINHMVAFIEREGDEKSNDIDEKTEEEYNILKGNTMQTERIKIDDEFRTKEQILKVTSLTDTSILANKIRLDEIRAKHVHIEELREKIRKQIRDDMRCILRYGRILQLLIIEGLYKLMETPVVIKCREQDLELIQKILPTIIAAYKATTRKDLEMKVDDKNFLAKNCLGGIALLKENHKIGLTNTLDDRLNRVIEYCIPAIQKSLFNITVS